MRTWEGTQKIWAEDGNLNGTQTGLWPIQISIRGPYLLCLSRPLGRDKTKESIGQGLWPSPMRFGWPSMSALTRTIRNICSKLDQKSNFSLLLTNRHREDRTHNDTWKCCTVCRHFESNSCKFLSITMPVACDANGQSLSQCCPKITVFVCILVKLIAVYQWDSLAEYVNIWRLTCGTGGALKISVPRRNLIYGFEIVW